MKFPDIKGKALLAPLAGVSDAAFRELARKYGAALSYTEFVSAVAVVRGNEKTKLMLKKAGITSYQQIAEFTEQDIRRVSDEIGSFPRRIKREAWIKQARMLIGKG